MGILASVLATIFIVAASLIVYVYLLYPCILWLATAGTRESNSSAPKLVKSVTLIIPAHNEESVIAQKLSNHLELDSSGFELRLCVVADNCTDKTNEIVAQFQAQHLDKIDLYKICEGRGKTNALNQVVPQLDSDVLVFSDANVMLDKQALQYIVETLANDDIAGVAGQLTYVNSGENGATQTSSLYWRYEEWIKARESQLDSIMGADGSIFAIKQGFFKPLPTHVLDDFCTSMGVLLQGSKFKFDKRVQAFEQAASGWEEEFSRKIRIATRSYDSYRYLRHTVLRKLSSRQLWMFYSHKVIRWHTFSLMLIAAISNMMLVWLAPQNMLWLTFLVLQTVLYCTVIIEWKTALPMGPFGRLIHTLRYFILANYATALGIVRSLTGNRIENWKSPASSRTH